MNLFFIVLAFMLLIMAAMAIGVIMGRRPIAGSCGGLNRLGMKEGCDICGGKDAVCEEENLKGRSSARRQSDESRGADLGYDAATRR